ncbi:MAG: hypothetical protein LBM13_04415 [Candidatus Ancillula sp.]|jgi:cell filamentation protein|nr:hypothetical protein [Candidatus Ancillula sp.]
MELPDFIDPYLDPKLGILTNLVGANTDTELSDREADLVSLRQVEFSENLKPLLDSFSLLDELQKIHYNLFQDVYQWAGRIRTVDIRKNQSGSDYFLPVSMIDQASIFVTR